MTTHAQAVTKRVIAGRYTRSKRIIGGEEVDPDVADILTCHLAAFERMMARQYPDWNQFVVWMEERNVNVI